MLRFVARHGLVRLFAGRAVPVLLVWDLAVLADRTRRIPVVDRSLRRVAGAARQGLGTVIASPRWPALPSRPRRRRPLWTPDDDA